MATKTATPQQQPQQQCKNDHGAALNAMAPATTMQHKRTMAEEEPAPKSSGTSTTSTNNKKQHHQHSTSKQWCSFKAAVPVTIQDNGTRVRTQVTVPTMKNNPASGAQKMAQERKK